MTDDQWHLYDEPNGWEVCRTEEGLWEIRQVTTLVSHVLDAETWNKVRSGELDERTL